jgi:hypothetical protein
LTRLIRSCRDIGLPKQKKSSNHPVSGLVKEAPSLGREGASVLLESS